jgi:hypothetical protein
MKNVESIERLLDTLLALKVTLRDTAEPSISHQLDEAIAEIQGILENDEDSDLASVKALDVLGKFFSCLPSIAKLIELFYD